MNVAILNRSSPLLIYGLPTLIIFCATTIAFTPFFAQHPELAIGITYDLTLSAPLLYLFLIRKTKIPKITVVPFFTVGIIIASFILPGEQQSHLDFIKFWIAPVVELGVLAFVGLSAYKTFQTYKFLKGKSSDVLTILRETCRKTLTFPILANVFAFEIAVFYYAFLSWKKSKPAANTFTYHKKNGAIALYAAFIFIISMETIVIHVLVAMWSALLAWILTLSSLYIVWLFFAHIKAILQRPIEVADDKVFIRYGLLGEAEIDLDNIESVELSSVPPAEKDDAKRISPLGELEQFNTIIQLKQESTTNGFYGIKSKYKTLLLFVDENQKFKQLITTNDTN